MPETSDKIIEHTFTAAGEHIENEVPSEEFAQLNRMLTTERRPKDVVASVAAARQSVASTPAAPSEADDELEELRARYAEKTGISPDEMIVERKIGGKKRFIKLLLWPDLARIGEMVGGDLKKLKRNKFESDDIVSIRLLTKALLSVAVVCSKENPSPYFSEAKAAEYVSDPAASALVMEFFTEITKINPSTLPKSLGASAQSTK